MLHINTPEQLGSVIRIIGTAVRFRHLGHARAWAGILIEGVSRIPADAASARLKMYAERLAAVLRLGNGSERTIMDLLRSCRREVILIGGETRCAHRRRKRAPRSGREL